MKVKTSHIIFLFLISSVLYGRYLLMPQKQPEKKLSAAKAIVETPKKVRAVTTTKSMDWTYADPVAEFETKSIEQANIPTQLSEVLTALQANQEIQSLDLAEIIHCSSCLELLQKTLLSGNLSNKQLAQLASLLTQDNHPELATLLIETTAKMLHQSSNSQRNTLLINALAKFNSVEVAKTFTDYLLGNENIPLLLHEALLTSINETSNRTQVAAAIVEQFNDSNDAVIRDKFLEINHPEALAQISVQALTANNTELYNQALELLKTNPSQYALDALLAMPQMQSSNADEVNQIVESAYQLAYAQFSGNRLDFIEQKLAQGSYSEQNKALVLDILSHSEDQLRSAEIIARFSNNN